MNAVKYLRLLAAGSALALATPLAANAETSTLFILDGSNSMWGQVDGTAKIDSAKRVLMDLLGELPTDASVGLMAYGYNREGDCRDVEMVSPIIRNGRSLVRSSLDIVVPKGKTPIAEALEKAAAQFTDRSAKNNLVLITDGIDTCTRDACAVARDLIAGGLDLRIHVIGFGEPSDDTGQLQCIADAGGGRYYHVNNVEGFRSSLQRDELASLLNSEEDIDEGSNALKVVVNKARLMRLETDAAVVMVANPDIADVAIESPRMVFLVGRVPGETNLFVLDADGNEIFQSPLVVVPNPDREVTVHRRTAESTVSCAPRCAMVPTPGAPDDAAGAGGGAPTL